MKISLPSNIEFIKEQEDNTASLVIEPLFPGYGATIGNALRRVLLSSLPGAAVTAIRIDGVDHEFTTLEDIKEDMVNVVLNVKGLRLKMHDEEPVTLTIDVKKEGSITAADIQAPSSVEVVNQDHHIVTTTNNRPFKMELVVERGLGFSATEERNKDNNEVGMIAVDAIFTSVRKVSLDVDSVRVGKRTDFERVTMKITTDGTVEPKAAVDSAAKILMDHFSLFTEMKEMSASEKQAIVAAAEAKEEAAVKEREEAMQAQPIEELKLSTRTINALHGGNINTIEELKEKTERELLALSGFGDTALREIKKALETRGELLFGSAEAMTQEPAPKIEKTDADKTDDANASESSKE